MCQPHWDALRDAIRARGLYGLVSASGEEAVQRLTDQADRGTGADNFEPLMGAHNAIVANALTAVGPALLIRAEDGSHRCPLCYLQERHDSACSDPACAARFDRWIDCAADDMLALWRQLNAVTA